MLFSVRAAALYLQLGGSVDENHMETDWQIARVVDNSRIVSGQDATVREETATVQILKRKIWETNDIQALLEKSRTE